MKTEAALESPALSAGQEVLPEVSQQLPELSAKEVADAFVLQYYHILRVSPQDVHKFYKDASNMARPGSEGMMLLASTVQVSLSDATFNIMMKYFLLLFAYNTPAITFVQICLSLDFYLIEY